MEGKISPIMQVDEQPSTPLTSLMKTFIEDSTLDRHRLLYLEEALTEIEQLCSQVQIERQLYQKYQQERLHEKNKYLQLRNQVESTVHRLSSRKSEQVQTLTDSAITQAKRFLQRRPGKQNQQGRRQLALRQGKRLPSQSKRK